MFKEFFGELLQKHNVTPYRVAKETGISQGLMSEYKNGDKTPTEKNLKKIAEFFGVTVDYLLGNSTSTNDTPREFGNDELKFALFGDYENITDEELAEIKYYAKVHLEMRRREKALKEGLADDNN